MLFYNKHSIVGTLFRPFNFTKDAPTVQHNFLRFVRREAFRTSTKEELIRSFNHYFFTLLFFNQKKQKYFLEATVFYQKVASTCETLIYLDFYPFGSKTSMYRLLLNHYDLETIGEEEILEELDNKKKVLDWTRNCLLSLISFKTHQTYSQPRLQHSLFHQKKQKYFLTNCSSDHSKKSKGMLNKQFITKKLIGHFTKNLGNRLYVIFSVFAFIRNNNFEVKIYIPLHSRRFSVIIKRQDIHNLGLSFWSMVYNSGNSSIKSLIDKDFFFENFDFNVEQVRKRLNIYFCYQQLQKINYSCFHILNIHSEANSLRLPN